MIERALTPEWMLLEPGADLAVNFDRDGRPISPLEWSARHADDSYVTVAAHAIRGWCISTVWTGFDNSFTPPSRRSGEWQPLVYETKLFGPSGASDGDEYLELLRDLPDDPAPEQAVAALLAALAGSETHYATADEAAEGHDRTVRMLVALLGARPWQVQTWEQYTGQQWAIKADGWRLVIEGGAIRGLAREDVEVVVRPWFGWGWTGC